MKNKNNVIYGLRLKLEIPYQIKFKIFNREITVTNTMGEKSRYADIALTEEEMAYVYLVGKIKFAIQPQNKSILFSSYFLILKKLTSESILLMLWDFLSTPI
jgi:hypothetical protein